MRCDKNRNTSDLSNKMRYGAVNPVHVGVELLNQHERTNDRLVTKRLLFLIVNDSGKVGVSKMTQDDLAFRMNASSGKFSINALWASSLWKWREKGA